MTSSGFQVQVSINTVLSFTVYECPEPVFTPETARCLGLLRVPIERLAERYSSGAAPNIHVATTIYIYIYVCIQYMLCIYM